MMAMTRWGSTPMCSLFLSLGSVAVQNKESKMSCPKLENSLSAIYGKNKMSYTVYHIPVKLCYLYVQSSNNTHKLYHKKWSIEEGEQILNFRRSNTSKWINFSQLHLEYQMFILAHLDIRCTYMYTVTLLLGK